MNFTKYDFAIEGERRVNQTMRTVVSLANKIAEESRSMAAEYCRDHGVPLSVTRRVLSISRADALHHAKETVISNGIEMIDMPKASID